MKKKRKEIIIAFLIILSLFLFSCKGIIKGDDRYEMERRIKELYSGTQALVINFYQGTPPEEVMQETNYKLIFDIENKGAFQIRNGYLSIATDQDYVNIKDANFANEKVQINRKQADKTSYDTISPIKFDLAGRTIYERRGETKQFDATLYAKKLENLSLYHDTLVRVTACYDYTTYLVADVCVNIDQFKRTIPVTGTCKYQPLKFSGQGAPVGISLVDVNILPWDKSYRPEFYIEVKNYGTGNVLSVNDIENACTNKPLDYSSFNVVKIAGKFLNKTINCTPEKVILKDGFGKTRCYTERFTEQEIKTSRSFLSPLVMNFTYGYTETWSVQTRITKLPEIYR